MLISATGPTEAFFRNLGEWAPREIEVSIDECRLTPKMLSATVGDTLVITNHTNGPYLPTAGPSTVYEALLPGQSRRVELTQGGITWVKCGFSLSCLRSDLVILRQPVHTVTGRDGTFEMRNVPADVPVQIHAWHPFFRESTVETRVTQNGSVEVVLTVTPIERVPPTAARTRPPIAGAEPGPMGDFPGGRFETPSPPRQRPRTARP